MLLFLLVVVVVFVVVVVGVEIIQPSLHSAIGPNFAKHCARYA